jgi:tetratricopeptide (TPR) repeat protein
VGGDESVVRNTFDGQADIAVQVGHVEGGINIHSRRKREAARLVPAPTPHFTNQVRVLAKTDTAVARAAELMTVVYCGLPGVGKREVARFWTSRHTADYPDGLFHADLSHGSDVDGFESAVLREFLLAADVEAAQIPDTAEGRAACFRSWSTGKRVLVSLDDAKSPSQVRMLSPGPGQSVVLVTAAAELTGLSARREVAYIDLSPLEDDAAEELLIRIVGRERIEDEPAAVRSLMATCAGLPIALCVVGAMIAARRRRSIARFVDDLSDERRRLAALSMDDDLSITAVFNMAYRRLNPVAQRCYRLVGVHPGNGDISLDALRAVIGAPVQSALDELVAAGLLRESEDDRYLSHSLIRLHAKEIAAEPQWQAESEHTLSSLLTYYRDRAAVAGLAMMPQRGWLEMFFADDLGGPLPAEPDRWMADERENLLAVVKSLYQAECLADVCLLAVALWPLHERGKYLDDLVSVNELAVAAAKGLGRPDLLALSSTQLGFGHLHRGDSSQAHKIFVAAVEAAEESGIAALLATAVESGGLAAVAAGDLAAAEPLLRRNLAMAEEIKHDRRLALARLHLAKAVPPDEALALLRASSVGFRELVPADDYNAAKADLWLGRTLTRLHDFTEADQRLADALAVMRFHDKPFDEAHILDAMGDLAAERGADPVPRYQESLALFESGGFMADTRRVQDKINARDK